MSSLLLTWMLRQQLRICGFLQLNLRLELENISGQFLFTRRETFSKSMQSIQRSTRQSPSYLDCRKSKTTWFKVWFWDQMRHILLGTKEWCWKRRMPNSSRRLQLKTRRQPRRNKSSYQPKSTNLWMSFWLTSIKTDSRVSFPSSLTWKTETNWRSKCLTTSWRTPRKTSSRSQMPTCSRRYHRNSTRKSWKQ